MFVSKKKIKKKKKKISVEPREAMAGVNITFQVHEWESWSKLTWHKGSEPTHPVEMEQTCLAAYNKPNRPHAGKHL